jgi:hypothetical protein
MPGDRELPDSRNHDDDDKEHQDERHQPAPDLRVHALSLCTSYFRPGERVAVHDLVVLIVAQHAVDNDEVSDQPLDRLHIASGLHQRTPLCSPPRPRNGEVRAISFNAHRYSGPSSGGSRSFRESAQPRAVSVDLHVQHPVAKSSEAGKLQREGVGAGGRTLQSRTELSHHGCIDLSKERQRDVPSFRLLPADVRTQNAQLINQNFQRVTDGVRQHDRYEHPHAYALLPTSLSSSIVATVSDEPRRVSPSVTPLDVDAVRTVQIGTALWVIALVATLIFREQLQDDGREWWMWTCVAGVILGFMGIIITTRRRRRLARAEAQRS